MQKNACHCTLKSIHSLCEKSGDHTRKHISRTAFCHGCIACQIKEVLPVFLGNYRPAVF